MTLPKFPIPPDSTDYVLQNGEEVIEIEVEGGKARRRRDYLSKPSSLRVFWIFEQAEYQYFKAFFNSSLKKGSLPFLMDLIVDNPYLQEHTVSIKSGSLTMSDPLGLSIRVEAELEVQLPIQLGFDEMILFLWDKPDFLNTLEQLTNYDLQV